MFERYSEHARRALFFSRFEASQAGWAAIEPEHLLLGVLREDRGVSARILARATLSVDAIRTEIQRSLKSDGVTRPGVAARIEIPFSETTKAALQHAAEEADRLEHDHIGAEHLLLALLRAKTSIPGRILADAGLELAATRLWTSDFVAEENAERGAD